MKAPIVSDCWFLTMTNRWYVICFLVLIRKLAHACLCSSESCIPSVLMLQQQYLVLLLSCFSIYCRIIVMKSALFINTHCLTQCSFSSIYSYGIDIFVCHCYKSLIHQNSIALAHLLYHLFVVIWGECLFAIRIIIAVTRNQTTVVSNLCHNLQIQAWNV